MPLRRDAAVTQITVLVLLRISTNTTKELYDWNPEGMGPHLSFTHTVFSINWPVLQLLAINSQILFSRGKQAPARSVTTVFSTFLSNILSMLFGQETNEDFIYRLPAQYMVYIPNFCAPHQGSFITPYRHSSAGGTTIFLL